MAVKLKKDRRILKLLVNKNFSFADLDRKFEGVDSTTGNIRCPFHENSGKKLQAKMYFREEEEIFVLMCFTEHKTFTAYDFVEKILCEQKGKYKDVLNFLESNLNKAELLSQYEYLSKNLETLDSSSIEKKIEYIDNVFNESNSTSEYIERLYTA